VASETNQMPDPTPVPEEEDKVSLEASSPTPDPAPGSEHEVAPEAPVVESETSEPEPVGVLAETEPAPVEVEVSLEASAVESQVSEPESLAPPEEPEPVPAEAGPAAADGSLRARLEALWERLKGWPLFRTRRRTIITLVIGVPLVLCIGSWLFGSIAFADAAHLVELKGLVQSRQGEDAQWEPAQLNQLLRGKDWVRTGAESSARLRFFDVSTVDMEGETEISISQVSKRRGGNGTTVVLKVWLGKTAVRAVRFVDPKSSFRVDSPTASTVVRGARFSMTVAKDGTTQIDLEEGTAEVEVNGETVVLAMGERITLEPGGLYEIEQVFEPDAQLVADKIVEAWEVPGDEFRPELTENDVNQFLAAMSDQPGFFLEDTQVWFVDGEARVATTVAEPTRFDLSAALSFEVEDGQLKPKVRAMAAGVFLPVPGPVLDQALELVLDQLKEYVAQVYTFVELEEIWIEEGRIIIIGREQPDAPVYE
jgi:hypothetical protein